MFGDLGIRDLYELYLEFNSAYLSDHPEQVSQETATIFDDEEDEVCKNGRYFFKVPPPFETFAKDLQNLSVDEAAELVRILVKGYKAFKEGVDVFLVDTTPISNEDSVVIGESPSSEEARKTFLSCLYPLGTMRFFSDYQKT